VHTKFSEGVPGGELEEEVEDDGVIWVRE